WPFAALVTPAIYALIAEPDVQVLVMAATFLGWVGYAASFAYVDPALPRWRRVCRHQHRWTGGGLTSARVCRPAGVPRWPAGGGRYPVRGIALDRQGAGPVAAHHGQPFAQA
ncbi:MAG: hypothetical protein M3Q71_02565, partial [Chloroflexota bacterium]|nr:hypothetical protein [Chloroflexota bacterium]